jgi:DNA polymerase-1
MKIIRTEQILDPASLPPDVSDWVYNGLDCCVTLEVLEKIEGLLDNTTRNTYEFSKSLQAPILEMSMRGVLVDLEQRNRVLALYRDQLGEIQSQLDRILKEGLNVSCNWRSPKQLGTLFYDVLGLQPIYKRNAHGKMSPTTNRDAIEKLSSYYYAAPIAIRILALRDIDKKRQFLETGIDSDNRMRCNFNIAGTNTGRLASSMSDYGTGTNLQNVDRELRSVFIPDRGMKFGNIDLEQADARNVGAVCWNLFVHTHGEKFAGAYLNACESGDLHTTVCTMAYTDLPWTDDKKLNRALADGIAYRGLSYRDLAKKLGHGTNYYGQPGTMAKHSKVQRSAIESFQSRYFKAFAAIPEWHKWVKEQLRETQQITTLLGRRRHFFGHPQDQATLREAIAFEPQSLTADEINQGMLALWRASIVQLLVQVHDSLLFQYPEEREAEIMEQATALIRVPIPLHKGRVFEVPSDAKVGWNWGDVTTDKSGRVNNPFGLQKYKGNDSRKRPVGFFDGAGI